MVENHFDVNCKSNVSVQFNNWNVLGISELKMTDMNMPDHLVLLFNSGKKKKWFSIRETSITALINA